ncbi:hypothetical protein [Streptomyces malaysiensis]|uniref:hypothetical protein n=1 Tax=Streptomyces malaysiensis TaxID=92644 RepID=UPI00115F0681|nr:hypothetical protein [Streptomyces malaysiensis]
MGASHDDFDRQDVDNDISGTVYGAAAQFGNVYGDVHFHGPSTPHFPDAEKPKQGANAANRKKGGANAKGKKREAAEQAKQRRREEDKKAVKGCALLVLLLGVIGFSALGFYTHDWATAGLLVGVISVVLFLWGAGMTLHDD